MKVVYVAGKGRSGSTLLDRVLGQMGGWESTGELWRIWDWGLQLHYLCGCGRPIGDCPQWTAVLDEAFGDGIDVAAALDTRDRVLRWSHAPALLAGRADRHVEAYAGIVTRLYRAIATVTGAEVVVDSSKWPFDPVALGLVPELDVRVIQLVRDPRAVAFSWTREKRAGFVTGEDEPMMRRFPPVHSALSWTARQAVAELARTRARVPWLTLRYEDFATAPRPTLERILAFVGAGTMPGLTADRTIDLGSHHMIGGNPGREVVGPIEITPDDEWRRRLAPGSSRLVTALTFPLLHRYGYSVRRNAREPV